MMQWEEHTLDFATDLTALAAVDLFVGSMTSNVGRLVQVLRRQTPSSSVSVQGEWHPG